MGPELTRIGIGYAGNEPVVQIQGDGRDAVGLGHEVAFFVMGAEYVHGVAHHGAGESGALPSRPDREPMYPADVLPAFPPVKPGADGISENYRSYGSSGKAWLGTALSVRLMKAIKIWGHDAFYDYCDRWL